jgi:CRP-like cAMP-binding protein
MLTVPSTFSDAGKSFGEIALMSKDAVRNASIVADDPTDLLVVSRLLFNRSLKVRHIFAMNASIVADDPTDLLVVSRLLFI